MKSDGAWAAACHTLACALGVGFLIASAGRGQDFIDAYTFTTLAGSPGERGSADGESNIARFWLPHGVAVDAAGNVYVADNMNCTIRKIGPDGWVTTLAGSAGKSGTNDGVGSAARFNYPMGVATDRAGNVYVADNSSTIRKITPARVVTTLAGRAGHPGTSDGLGSAARFGIPSGVAIDDAGNVYVADSGFTDWTDARSTSFMIRKITPGGWVTTLAGRPRSDGCVDGWGSAAQFSHPTGVAVDGAGTVYVADCYNDAIRQITPAGWVSTLAGSPEQSGFVDGIGTVARFSGPWAIAADRAGNLFVTDLNNATIRHISPSGVVSTIGGWPRQPGSADGIGSAARFDAPIGIAVDDAGILYVADQDNHTIRKGTPLSPRISSQPQNQAVLNGQAATFSVVVRTVPGPAYQWQRSTDRGTSWTDLPEDESCRGTTTDTLAVPAVTLSMDGQLFRCVVRRHGAADAVSEPAALAVSAPVGREVPPATTGGRLLNLSARAVAGQGAGALIGGMVITGGQAEVILRAIGPTLAALHEVPGVLADPQLAVFSGASEVARNDDWGTAPDASEVATRSAQMGAFALPPDSRDAALLLTLDPGEYTLHVDGGQGDAGVALLEIYLVANSSLPGRLANLSARAQVGTGAEVLIAGFVVDGETTVLVRGVGPELRASYGLAGALEHPCLEIFAGSDLVDRVQAWGTTYLPAQARSLFERLGAFPLADGSTDTAAVVILPGGARTAQIKGLNLSSGISLAEIYLVD